VADPLQFPWAITRATHQALTVPVLDSANSAVTVTGWAVDAVVEDRPGGRVLYTWPAGDATASGTSVQLTIPAAVSAGWTFRTAWYRVNITDPNSDPDDPNTQRILQGRFVLDPD
jgi:aspartokinase-like uncharacterized kinase